MEEVYTAKTCHVKNKFKNAIFYSVLRYLSYKHGEIHSVSTWVSAVWQATAPTCSGLTPGGTHAYSSSAHPESSSEVELLWKPTVIFPIFPAARGSMSGPRGEGRSPLSLRSRFTTHECCGYKKRGLNGSHLQNPPFSFKNSLLNPLSVR